MVLLLSTFTATGAWADNPTSGSCGSNLTWVLSDVDNDTKYEKLTISGTGYMNNYSELFRAPWDNYRTDIAIIEINEGVTSIGELAFYGCSYLTYISIPSSVESIDGSAFDDCTSLTSFRVSSESKCFKVNEGVLYTYDGKTIVRFPQGKLAPNYKIDSGVETIGHHAFYGLDFKYFASFTIPSTVSRIYPGAFTKTDRYYSLNSGDAFYLDNWLIGFKYYKPSGTFEIAEGTVGIADEAFNEDVNLTSVTIPASVKVIGNSAFNGCSGLANVTIGDNVTRIGQDAFTGTKLFENLNDGDAQYLGNWLIGFKNNVKPTGTFVIKDGTKGIADNAFDSSTGLTSITIPNSVTNICDKAFRMCSGLTSITIPNSVTTIGNEAFSLCAGLTSITIPASVTAIGKEAFYHCSGMASVTIGSGVTSIGCDAFLGCSSVYNVYCYADPAALTWIINSPKNFQGNVPPDRTHCHVFDAEAWTTKFGGGFCVSFVNLVTTSLTANQAETGEYWSTYFNNEKDIIVNPGTKVFKVKLVGTGLTMTEISDRTITMGQGVVLKSSNANIQMCEAPAASIISYDGNSLLGTMTEISNPGNAYVLSYKSGEGKGVGFYRLKSDGKIGANKAYLTYTAPAGVAREFFGFEETTGIESLTPTLSEGEGACYDLQGRRVAQLTKGLYIINGKKVFIR